MIFDKQTFNDYNTNILHEITFIQKASDINIL